MRVLEMAKFGWQRLMHRSSANSKQVGIKHGIQYLNFRLSGEFGDRPPGYLSKQ